MRIDIPDDSIRLLIRALIHYSDYMKASNRDGQPYLDLVERIERKPPAKEQEPTVRKGKRTG